MAGIDRFEDIEAWKAGREAIELVYEITRSKAFAADYALSNQIRRAAISIISNIAEGFERNGNKEFINFLSIAKGSCGEVRSQMYIALDQKYVDEEKFHEIYSKLNETSRLIAGFMRYLQQTELKGSKFK